MKDFTNKTAVVTGAASGMGRAFAERFAREGMKVVLADVEAPALDRAIAELRDSGFDVIGVRTDVRSFDAVQALADAAVEAYGKVHVVCNNAGVEGYLEGPIWEATEKDWQWTLGVNFQGVVNGVRAFMPLLLEHGEEGHMVNTCSSTSVVTASNMYAITKHAVLALTETIYTQLKQRNSPVSITALCPGIVNTQLFAGNRNRPTDLQNEDAATKAANSDAMRKWWFERAAASSQPNEIADLLVEAIRDDHFYLITDHEWDERIEARATAIANRTNPIVSPPIR